MASKTLNHQQQMTVLDQSKTLAESALQMLYAAKEGGGNPKVRWLCGIKGERGRQVQQKNQYVPAVQSRDMFAVKMPVTALLMSLRVETFLQDRIPVSSQHPLRGHKVRV